MTNILVRVADITEEAAGIRTLRLVRVDGEPPGPYEAGAHIDVTGPTGVLRQYSLCGPPGDPSALFIAVKLEPGSRGGSAALHTVAVGDDLKIGTPRNLLTLAGDADRHLLVAAGIGVTPLLSMAYELHARGAGFELHYFAWSREEAASRGHGRKPPSPTCWSTGPSPATACVSTGEWPLVLDVWIEHVVEEVANAHRNGSKGTIEGPYYMPDAPLLPADATASWPRRRPPTATR